MLLFLLYLYLSVLVGAFLATISLIFLGLSWGQLPHLYLRIITKIQTCFPYQPLPPPKRYQTPQKSNNHRNNEQRDGLDISFEATKSAIEAIINDDLSTCFSPAPSKHETLLRLKPLSNWNNAQRAIFYVCFLFRVSFLLPVRIALLTSSFVFVAAAGFFASFKALTATEKTWVAIIYCRLFCSSMGLVANYRNKQNRPRRPGVAVSNHLTPNDIQILFAGTPHGSSYGYVVTGQKHNGIIGVIEHLVEKLCPSLWLERKCSNERQNFLSDVLNIAREDGPVLLFPEGYCSNNTQILQFRKAIFEGHVNIYPIAVRQTPEYGDGFWSEDHFQDYLLRAMTSWALVYDIQYLEMETRYPDEDNVEFAKRIQNIIAKAADIPCCQFGGNVWYKKEEREKLMKAAQENNAKEIKESAKSNNNKVSWRPQPIIEHIDSVIDSQCEKLITVYN